MVGLSQTYRSLKDVPDKVKNMFKGSEIRCMLGMENAFTS